MRQLFTRNLGWKLLSLLVAIVLWIGVAREPEVATSLAAPVDFKSPPDNVDIVGTLPDRVRLELRGPSGRLTRDNLSAVAVVLDLSDAQPGERTYTIRGRNLNLPAGVAFYRAVPAQLTLHFEQLIVKEERVQPSYVNQPSGYRMVSQQVTPAKVQVRGSAERVRGIDQVKTDPMDLSGVTGESVLHTRVNVGDPLVRVIDAPDGITVRLKLEKITDGGAR
jgi:YbbR domain-containing protein